MQLIFGSCVSCGVGKMHYQDMHSDSTSCPSAAIGSSLTPIGVNFVDDWSHFTTVLGAKSKSHKAILECMTQLISIYNARGHQIKSFCTDSEPIYQSIRTPPLQLLAHDSRYALPQGRVSDPSHRQQSRRCPRYCLSHTLILQIKAFIANQVHSLLVVLQSKARPQQGSYQGLPALRSNGDDQAHGWPADVARWTMFFGEER